LRVTAQLVRPLTASTCGRQSYDRTADDALKVQQDIAGNVARMLDIYLDDKQRAQMFASGTHVSQAFDAYLRGRALFPEAHRTDFGCCGRPTPCSKMHATRSAIAASALPCTTTPTDTRFQRATSPVFGDSAHRT
jgi:hypothetical protein